MHDFFRLRFCPLEPEKTQRLHYSSEMLRASCHQSPASFKSQTVHNVTIITLEHNRGDNKALLTLTTDVEIYSSSSSVWGSLTEPELKPHFSSLLLFSVNNI